MDRFYSASLRIAAVIVSMMWARAALLAGEPTDPPSGQVQTKTLSKEAVERRDSLSVEINKALKIRDFSKAEALSKEVMKIVESELGPDDKEVAELHRGIGWMLMAQSKNTDAESSLRRSAITFERAGQSRNPHFAEVCILLSAHLARIISELPLS